MDAGFPSHANQGEREAQYSALWTACAGPHVYVPGVGEKVYYFPQGHLEQVKAYTEDDCSTEIPNYDLDSKILCKVVHVQLKAEVHTDEVFAQITLVPAARPDEVSLGDEVAVPVAPRAIVSSFVKVLTPSDIRTHGGLTVRKRHAVACFPPLKKSQGSPVQDLVAEDLHGCKWPLRHIYRGNPKRHLLTSGWSNFVATKKLSPGDACIFLRGENGHLSIGVRRAKRLNSSPTSVISGHTMQHGILAGACHAVISRSMFTVYYHPWTSPSEFITPLHRYRKLNRSVCSVGMRFRMQFSGDEGSEKRAAGVIIAIEDIDPSMWCNSEWKCLKVQWDSPSDTYLHSERVSPWEIELIEPTITKPVPHKRTQPLDPSSSLLRDVKYTPHRQKKALQGQERGKISAQEPPHLVYSSKGHWGCYRNFPENHEQSSLLGSRIVPSSGNTAASCTTYLWPSCITYGVSDNAAIGGNILASRFPATGPLESKISESMDEKEVPVSQPTGCDKLKIFGVNLDNKHPELPSPQVAHCELCSPCSTPTFHSSIPDTIQVSEPSKDIPCDLLEKQFENFSVTNRSCTKVHKCGTALGRSVHLLRFDGYEELTSELDQMFDFKGSLVDINSQWHVKYMDEEGRMIPIGDNPWHEFCLMARRMFVCPKEETEILQPRKQQPSTNCSLLW